MTTYCINAFTHGTMFLRTLLYAGVDTIMLDNEHELIPPGELAQALAILNGRARAIIRTEETSLAMIDKYWPLGVRSFLLPKVEDLGELAAIAARVGALAGDTLDDCSVIPLLESRAALSGIDRIARIPEVRTVTIGPFDLARDMGIGDYRTNPGFIDYLEECVRRIDASGKIAGLYVIPEWLDRFRATPLGHYSFGSYEIIGDFLKRLKAA